MRRQFAVLALAALAIVAVAATQAATAQSARTVKVSITAVSFVPRNVTITTGDKVTWTNKDTKNHQVTCQQCPFTSPVLRPGKTFSFTFKTTGVFDIVDALHTATRGSVTVEPPNPTVSLLAKRPAVTFGGMTALSGQVSSGSGNEVVTLTASQCGSATARAKLAVLRTSSGGYFSYQARPLANTVYQALWHAHASPEATVKVRPQVSLAKTGRHRYVARVRAGQSFADKVVVFQRYKARRHTWVRVRTVVLKHIGTIAPTEIAGRTFHSSVRAHLRVRLILKGRQAAPCYVQSTSNVIRS